MCSLPATSTAHINMKKIAIIILAWAYTMPGCQAQSDTTTSVISLANVNWNIGVKAGVNITSAYSIVNEVFDTEPRASFAGGIFAEIPLGKYILLQPEVLVSQRCLQANGILKADPYTVIRRTTYLDVPVLVAFKPTSAVKLLAGPQYSYLLKQRDSFPDDVSRSLQEEFNSDVYRSHTLCIMLGAEFNIERFVICSRLGWDLLSNRQDSANITPEYRMIWYQFMVGYKVF